jgi:hypothetical protein
VCKTHGLFLHDERWLLVVAIPSVSAVMFSGREV